MPGLRGHMSDTHLEHAGKTFSPNMGKGIHPVIDSLEMRIRTKLIRGVDGATDPSEITRRALEYASEAEQRIAELSARVSTLESLAQTDELTGLYNRRGFKEILNRNLFSAARYDEMGVLAYFDLNKFKDINDSYGHAAGDEVLRRVGDFLRRSIRSTDFAARLGGDEFAILFVRGEHAKARERARTMARKIGRLVVPWHGHKFTISASVGLASYDGATAAEELIDRADRAMYREKHKRPDAAIRARA